VTTVHLCTLTLDLDHERVLLTVRRWRAIRFSRKTPWLAHCQKPTTTDWVSL